MVCCLLYDCWGIFNFIRIACYLNKLTIFEEGQVLLFNKPVYWTSFDLVNKVRIIIRSTFGIKKIKVGHAGTLDPLASGLMIICTGRETKKIDEFRDLDKEYIATYSPGGDNAFI